MVGSRCVVQGCSNRRNKAAGLALHASPTDRTRDLWVRFVRIQCENFFTQPQAKFVICLVHFEENCFLFLLVLSIRHSVGNLNPVLCPAYGEERSHLQKGIQRDKVV